MGRSRQLQLVDGPATRGMCVLPDIRRYERCGGVRVDVIHDDDGVVLGEVAAHDRSDLDDEDVQRAMVALWAAFKLARARREAFVRERTAVIGLS